MPIWESLALACGLAIGMTIAYLLSVASAISCDELAQARIRAQLIEQQSQAVMAEAERKMAERLSQ